VEEAHGRLSYFPGEESWYEITREEEVPVGQRIREETTTDFDRRDRVTSTTEYRVRTRYEWRIHYTCR
jgi:hypothetical protein